MKEILLVDDDDDVRTMMKMRIERLGYKVSEARDGEQAIAMFRSNAHDMIITDIVMPEKEGLEIIRELRQDFPDVKIIAISGGGKLSATGYLEMAQLFGADYVFAKPVPWQEMVQAIEQLIGSPDK